MFFLHSQAANVFNFCNEAVKLNGSIPLRSEAAIVYRGGTKLTAVTAAITGQHTVAFLGTHYGSVKKVTPTITTTSTPPVFPYDSASWTCSPPRIHPACQYTWTANQVAARVHLSPLFSNSPEWRVASLSPSLYLTTTLTGFANRITKVEGEITVVVVVVVVGGLYSECWTLFAFQIRSDWLSLAISQFEIGLLYPCLRDHSIRLHPHHFIQTD